MLSEPTSGNVRVVLSDLIEGRALLSLVLPDTTIIVEDAMTFGHFLLP
jgi:hypothetical protein